MCSQEVICIRCPMGRQPWATMVSTAILPCSATPMASEIVCAVAKIQSVRAGLPAAGCKTAYLRSARESVVESHQKLLALYAERIGQDHELGIIRGRHMGELLPRGWRGVTVGQVTVVYVKAHHIDIGQDGCCQGEPGTVFHLVPGAYHTTTGAPYEKAFAEQFAHQSGKFVVSGGVVRRHERHDEIRLLVAQRVSKSHSAHSAAAYLRNLCSDIADTHFIADLPVIAIGARSLLARYCIRKGGRWHTLRGQDEGL